MIAWVASDESNSGTSASQGRERLSQQCGQGCVQRRTTGHEPLPDAPSVPQHGQCGGGDVFIDRLGQDPFHPSAHLSLRRRGLGHLVRHIAGQAFRAVFEDGGDKRVLQRKCR